MIDRHAPPLRTDIHSLYFQEHIELAPHGLEIVAICNRQSVVWLSVRCPLLAFRRQILCVYSQFNPLLL
jgi:hypothetical protein